MGITLKDVLLFAAAILIGIITFSIAFVYSEKDLKEKIRIAFITSAICSIIAFTTIGIMIRVDYISTKTPKTNQITGQTAASDNKRNEETSQPVKKNTELPTANLGFKTVPNTETETKAPQVLPNSVDNAPQQNEDEQFKSLLMAIESKDINEVRKYLKNSININRSLNGFTPLTCASRTTIDIVTELINYGADVNLVDSNGLTPIYVAVNSQSPDITKILLEKGANVNTRYQQNESVLFLASALKNIECMQLLIKHGADVNIKENRNETPIFAAITCKFIPGIQLLIDDGADLSIRDTYNLTPLATAKLGNDSEVIELLLKHNAPE